MQHGNSSSTSIHSYRNRNSNFLTFHLSKWLLSSPTKMLSSIPTLLFVAISTVVCINFSMRWFMDGICLGGCECSLACEAVQERTEHPKKKHIREWKRAKREANSDFMSCVVKQKWKIHSVKNDSWMFVTSYHSSPVETVWEEEKVLQFQLFMEPENPNAMRKFSLWSELAICTRMQLKKVEC